MDDVCFRRPPQVVMAVDHRTSPQIRHLAASGNSARDDPGGRLREFPASDVCHAF
jgi:hypothetical protein